MRRPARIALRKSAARGGAQAAGRGAGAIRPGAWADLMALDTSALALEGRQGDQMLDAWIFAAPEAAVRDLWSAGRRLVRDGRHHARETVEARFRAVMRGLRARL